jgi:glycosyltransferase involved in cell wall biosynthesis
MLTLAKALVRKGLRAAIVVYGDPAHLPTEVEGVSIVARRPYTKLRRLTQRIPETVRIWRALWTARPRTIVYMAAQSELGVIALFARATRRPLVYASASIIDFDLPALMTHHRGLVQRADLLAYKLGIRLARAVVVQTVEQVALCQSTFGRTPVLIESIGPIVDPEEKPAEAFLWVGRLVAYKRPLEYLALARAVPEAKFWMVGVPAQAPSSDEAQLVEEVATQASLVPNLELLAPRPHAELQDLMGRAVASVSTGDFEGMPNVLLEAWSRGVPALVLTHDPGGVVEAAGLGAFAEGSPQTLVELAREQWRSRDERSLISQRCRSYMQTHHAPDLIAEQWSSVLSGSHQGPATADASSPPQ